MALPVHSFDDELAGLDATATAEAVRAGELDPKEVVATAIRRAEAIDPELAAIASEDFERAAGAASWGRTGAFAGVPMFVKDMTAVEGLPTHNGSAACDALPAATHTGAIVRQMLDAGMVCLGKSTLPEFGFVPSTEFPDRPPTRNPWNPEHTAGGSSGGAAALVASGVVPIAHGQDGGGSVRIPAACTGLVGLKPSRGRLVTDPLDRLLPVQIVTDGVLTRSVRDTAAYYRMAELAAPPQALPPLGNVDRPPERRLTVGIMLDSPNGAPVDEPTAKVFEKTVELLHALGHSTREVTAPFGEQFVDDFIHYWSMLAFAVGRGGRVLFGSEFDRDRLGNVTRGLDRRFRSHLASTPGSIMRLRRTRAVFDEWMRPLDVVLTPTVTTVAPPIGELGGDLPYDVVFPRVQRWVGYTPMANATGAPAISLPMGVDDTTGLPVGMMFGGRVGDDGLLLRLARQVEDASPFGGLWSERREAASARAAR